jgi:hypothetical protein
MDLYQRNRYINYLSGSANQLTDPDPDPGGQIFKDPHGHFCGYPKNKLSFIFYFLISNLEFFGNFLLSLKKKLGSFLDTGGELIADSENYFTSPSKAEGGKQSPVTGHRLTGSKAGGTLHLIPDT